MGVTLRQSPATGRLAMKLAVLLSLAVFACASSVEKRDADPEPGYGHHPVYHVAAYHSPPHPYKYVPKYTPKYTPKYPVYGYGYGIHHHHKRSADPEPEPSADPEPEPSRFYGKPSYYGHRYVSPVYPSYGYHPAPAYKSYSPYSIPSYNPHHHHKRSAEPEPEPSKTYGLYSPYHKHYPAYHPAPYHYTPYSYPKHGSYSYVRSYHG